MKTLNTYITEWKASSTTMPSIKTENLFVYKIYKYQKIHLFNKYWPQLDDYIDKVYINGEHVKVNIFGLTEKDFKPDTYYIEIKDIDNIVNCKSMFEYCDELISVPLFDTNKVTNMYHMFNCCHNLKKIPVFNTSKVTNVSLMFCNCFDLDNIPLFDTSNVEKMSYMLYGCENLNEQNKKEWSKIYDFEKNDKKL